MQGDRSEAKSESLKIKVTRYTCIRFYGTLTHWPAAFQWANSMDAFSSNSIVEGTKTHVFAFVPLHACPIAFTLSLLCTSKVLVVCMPSFWYRSFTNCQSSINEYTRLKLINKAFDFRLVVQPIWHYNIAVTLDSDLCTYTYLQLQQLQWHEKKKEWTQYDNNTVTKSATTNWSSQTTLIDQWV